MVGLTHHQHQHPADTTTPHGTTGGDVVASAPVVPQVPHPRTESPGPVSTGAGSVVFCPGRLRAHRDLAHLTRDQLAATTGLAVTVIVAYERGTRPPTEPDLATLAAALNLTPDEFMGPLGADDSFEYWGLITAAMPPMTSDQLASVVTILRRIDQRQREDPTRDRPQDRHKPV